MRKIFAFVSALFISVILLAQLAYADTVSNTIIPITGCNAEDNAAVAGTFAGACDFPDGSALIANGGNTETHSANRAGTRYFGGVNTTSYNSSETECIALTSVSICYEWWGSVATIQTCDISVDANGGASYTAATTTCPGAVANPGVTCFNATASEAWSCSSFFGASGTRARAKSEAQKSGGNGALTLTWDVLYYNVTYRRDREAPIVTQILPGNGSTSFPGAIAFQYNVSDESAIANCSLIINNVRNQTNTSVTRNTTQSFTATLSAGSYTWSVNCTDNSTNKNNGSSATWSLIVAAADTIPPSVTINSPANDTLLNTTLITINVTATDSNMNYTNVSIINSTGSVVNSTTNTTNGNFVVTLGVPRDGSYNITATAYDLAGNSNSSTRKNITIDTTRPSVTINSPLSNAILNATLITINVTATDMRLNYTNISIINSVGAIVNSTTSATNGTFAVQLSVSSDGVYNITATAYDLAQNTNTSTSTNVSVDTGAPSVTINSPTSNSFVNTTTLAINVTATDTNLNYTNISIINSTGSIVNSTTSSTNGTFVVNLGVPRAGIYNITAAAYDRTSKVSTTTNANITVDIIRPSVTINSPANNSIIDSTDLSVAINVTATDTNLNYTNISIINSTGSIVNSVINATNGTFVISLTVPSNGVYNITATAYDLAQNTNISRVSNITIRTPLPIAFTSITPVNDTFTFNESFELNISINDSLKTFTFTWNGTNYIFYDSSLRLMLNLDNVSALGENSTSNHSEDVSQYSNNCTCSGMGPGCSWAAGKYGSSLSFNGSSYVDCGTGASLMNITTALSIEAWIKPVAWMTLYDTVLQSDSGGGGYRLWSPAGGTSIGGSLYNGTAVVRVNGVLTLNQWTHVLATYNGSQFILYLNGVAVNTTNTGGPVTQITPRFAIGRDTSLGRYFNGQIDEIKVYSRVLTPAEALAHYQTNFYKYGINKWAFYSNPSNLVEGLYTYQGSATSNSNTSGQTDLRYITIIHPTNLTIWDATETQRKYVNDSVMFYANYTSNRTGNPVVGAVCNISFDTPTGWTVPVTMTYNVTSKLYEYNRTFNFSDTYDFSVNCSKQFYQAQNATSTYWITSSVVFVYTDQAQYQACNIVYYKVWVYDVNDALIDSNLTVNVYNTSSSLQGTVSTNTGNGGTGIYLGSYTLNTTAEIGRWLIETIASSVIKGTQNFFVGTAATKWKIDIDFSPDSIVYNNGTSVTMNFTVWTKEGIRQTGLLPGGITAYIDSTSITPSLVASGEGYTYTHTASTGNHIINVSSGNVNSIRGFNVR